MKSLSTSNFINILGVFNFTLLLAVSASLLFAEPKSSEATTTSAQAGSSVYYANISNEDTVTIPVTPTSDQEEYTATNRIIFSNTCTAGSSIQISTSSSNNSLTRTGSDTGKKTIEAVTGNTGLTENTWGYKIEGSGNAFAQVPVSTSPVVLYNSTKSETNTPIDVVYGVKTDNNLPSGTYSNDVLYTLVVDNKCLQYTLKFDTGGGSAISDQSVNYGDTVDLSTLTTTKSGYIFGGWSNGTLDFTGSETAANPNPSNDFTVTLSAKWLCGSSSSIGYVTNGLLINTDGICNTRNEHSSSLSSWQDLSGNNIDISELHGITVNPNSIKLAGNKNSYMTLYSDTIKNAVNAGNYTVSVALATPQLSSRKTIIMFGTSYCCSTMNLIDLLNNTLHVAFWSNDVNHTITDLSNQNITLDYVYTNGTERIYINGTLASTLSHAKTTLVSNRIILGLYDDTGTNQSTLKWFFDGQYYSVRIYNRALSQTEVTQNYNIDKSRFGF